MFERAVSMAFDKLDHGDHPHTLMLKSEDTPFWCDLCKELGFHSRYSCEEGSCNYHLHRECAKASVQHDSGKGSVEHDFFQGCKFAFVKGGLARRRCDACRMDVKGSVYHCKDEKCGMDLHPCCANLPPEISDGEMKLSLHRKMPSSSECYFCGKRKVNGGDTWGYVSTNNKDCCLHIECVKRQLLENWMKQVKSSGTATTSVAAVDGGDVNRALVRRTPELGLPIERKTKAARASGKFTKFKKMVQTAITFIVAALLGDPTTAVAGVIFNLIHQ